MELLTVISLTVLTLSLGRIAMLRHRRRRLERHRIRLLISAVRHIDSEAGFQRQRIRALETEA